MHLLAWQVSVFVAERADAEAFGVQAFLNSSSVKAALNQTSSALAAIMVCPSVVFPAQAPACCACMMSCMQHGFA